MKTKQGLKKTSQIMLAPPPTSQTLDGKDVSIICVHCRKEFNETKLVGLSLICPYCGRPSDKSLLKSLNKYPF